MNRHTLFTWMSDVSLVLLVACVIGFAIDAWKRRDHGGDALRRFAYFCMGMAVFFGWFALVYLDRRCPSCIPAVDLVQLMGYEWYWPFRLMLLITLWRLWRALRQPVV